MVRLMISKDRFVNIMERLEKLDSKMNRVDSALYDLSPDFGGFHIPDVLEITLDILRDIFDDQDELIDYFVYELDFLRKFKWGCVRDKNDSPIDLSTWDKIYEFLIENMEG